MRIEREGLYCLDQIQQGTCNSVHSQAQTLFWYQRLGHSSSYVSSLFPFSANKACDTSKYYICPLAKQTRMSFPLSTTSSESPFDLIHVDIWGGYHFPSLSGA